ncbi:MAG: rhodanese-like domain-containing protein [Saprospiraceae bacterium]|nr:rhodanese-like domain-containing protein [Saprospiraceae bacterium]
MLRYIYSCVIICLCFSLGFAQALDQDPFASSVGASETISEGSTGNNYQNFQTFAAKQTDFAVQKISHLELVKEMESKARKFYVLDARSLEEYKVSRIKGARRVGYNDFSVERVWMLHRDNPIIVYCTNGERSKKVAKYLEMMGFGNVSHLGGVIDWVNEGYGIVDEKGNITKNLHVWKKEHGRNLKKGKAIY